MLLHVHGHQDKNKKFHELSFPSQLNVLMDSLSKKLVDDTMNDNNKVIPTPTQRLYLRSDQIVAHDIQNTLIASEMKQEVNTYYSKHHNISHEAMTDIDWDASKKGTVTRSEISYRKTIHNFRNTMTINKKWGRIESDLCPLCGDHPETVFHLFSCKQKDISDYRTNMFNRFFQSISKVNTKPSILANWKRTLEDLVNSREVQLPSLTMNPDSWTMIQVYQRQNRIGLQSFSKGFLSTRWAELQQQHYDLDHRDGENIHRWKRVVVSVN